MRRFLNMAKMARFGHFVKAIVRQDSRFLGPILKCQKKRPNNEEMSRFWYVAKMVRFEHFAEAVIRQNGQKLAQHLPRWSDVYLRLKIHHIFVPRKAAWKKTQQWKVEKILKSCETFWTFCKGYREAKWFKNFWVQFQGVKTLEKHLVWWSNVNLGTKSAS